MTDLDAAGARLAAYRPAPTPPVAELRRRAARRRTRRRATAAVAVLGLAAVALVATVAGSGPATTQVSTSDGPGRAGTHPATGLARVAHARGATPLDWGRVRLWLPPGWTLAAPSGRCWNAHDTVTITSGAPPACGRGVGLWLAPHAGPIPDGDQARTLNGGLTLWSSPAHPAAGSPTVSIDLADGVAFSSRGAAATAVLDTLGPSSLSAVLGQDYPTPVPHDWRTVVLDGFSAAVPPSWATFDAADGHAAAWSATASALACWSVPAVPGVLVGGPRPIMTCHPLQRRSTDLGDGLWLESVGPAATAVAPTSVAPTASVPNGGAASGWFGYAPLTDAVSLRGDPSMRVLLPSTGGGATGAATASVLVAGHGDVLEAVVGLGADPRTAEEILSSLRPVPGGGG